MELPEEYKNPSDFLPTMKQVEKQAEFYYNENEAQKSAFILACCWMKRIVGKFDHE
jgi:hypothetical protein